MICLTHQPAIVLGKYPLKESDLIVRLLGRETGKVSAQVKGARSSKKRFFGGLDIFDCGLFQIKISENSSRLMLIESFSERQPLPGLRERIDRFSFATLCLEVSDAFCAERDPLAGCLFNPLFLSLKSLNNAKSYPQCLAIAAYYILLCLKENGINILDGEHSMCPQTERWMKEMLALRAPIILSETKISQQGLNELLSYAENALGYKLKSGDYPRSL